MDDPNHLRIFVPSDIELQRPLLCAYHDSPAGMHYSSLSHDFYWKHMHKYVRNWICRWPQLIHFMSQESSHVPMQLKLYRHPFHTLGVDYVGELPAGNGWILTAVCPYSNYLCAIPVPDKIATTAANALFHYVSLQLGFPTVLQSDHGCEFSNALLHRITQLLSIRQVFTSDLRPPLIGATERNHWFLNSVLGIFCEYQQEKWEQFLQPAVYFHNASSISGTSDITPFFLVFGRDAPSSKTISLDLSVQLLPPDHCAKHMLSRMQHAHQRFTQIKSDLHRHQKDVYYRKARFLVIPIGKIVYIRKEPQTNRTGMTTRFYVLWWSFSSSCPSIWPNWLIDSQRLVYWSCLATSSQYWKVCCCSWPGHVWLSASYDAVINKIATASQACKHVYLHYQSARETLALHDKLRDLVKSCPYLQMIASGLYFLSL